MSAKQSTLSSFFGKKPEAKKDTTEAAAAAAKAPETAAVTPAANVPPSPARAKENAASAPTAPSTSTAAALETKETGSGMEVEQPPPQAAATAAAAPAPKKPEDSFLDSESDGDMPVSALRQQQKSKQTTLSGSKRGRAAGDAAKKSAAAAEKEEEFTSSSSVSSGSESSDFDVEEKGKPKRKATPAAGKKSASAAAPAAAAEGEKKQKLESGKAAASKASSKGKATPAAAAAAAAAVAEEENEAAEGVSADSKADLPGRTEEVLSAAAVAAGLDSLKYHPVKDAPYPLKCTVRTNSSGSTVYSIAADGAPVPYSALVSVFASIEATTKRLAITQFLCNFFRTLILTAPKDLLPAVYLCTNAIAPAYENLELGVGDSLLIKALSEATGRQPKELKAEAESKGDLGLVAEGSRAKQKTLFSGMFKQTAAAGGGGGAAGGAAAAAGPSKAGLTIQGVFQAFHSIAKESGKSSQDKKVGSIKRLLVTASGPEAKYIVRSMQGKLRIGLAKQTVLIALAQAITISCPMPAGGAAVGSAVEKEEQSSSMPSSSSSSSSNDAMQMLMKGSSSSSSNSGSGGAASTASAAARPRRKLRAGDAELVERQGAGLPPALVDAKAAYRWDTEDTAAELAWATETLKQVFSELPSYNSIVPKLLETGVEGARAACHLVPGVPVTPMLAKPTKGIREVLDRFTGVKFSCEWKYDGERAQVHITTPAGGAAAEGGAAAGGGAAGSAPLVRIFSRNSEDTTSKFPDLAIAIQESIAAATAAQRAAAAADAAGGGAAAAAGEGGDADSTLPFPFSPVQSCVLDGEAVAIDREKGTLLPFQILSTRARKDVSLEDIKVQVIFCAFDLLFLNGRSLLQTPLSQRRHALRSHFAEVPGRFSFAVHSESEDVDEIANFLNESVKGGCEGLMVKVLEGPESVYEPSKRSLNWLKLKKDYMDGLTDSLDLVPIGAWHGKGKRTGVFGAYLLACYDPDDETFQSITRVGTGFSDEMLAELTKAFREKPDCMRQTRPSNVLLGESSSSSGAEPDVFFDPENSEIWEVMAADLSVSPVHMAAVGKVDRSKGIALRFPRFIRRRDDKGPSDATTADQVAQMYRDQSTVSNLAAAGGEDEWD